MHLGAGNSGTTVLEVALLRACTEGVFVSGISKNYPDVPRKTIHRTSDSDAKPF